jgi:hypothetical protein
LVTKIAPQITSILNMSIDQSVFPDKVKKAQVTPLYKKNDPLLKTNYESLSNKISWGRQSNALERSIRTAARY